MSLLKYIDRIKRIDDLIKRKATGNAESFAKKLGISRSQLLQDLKELRELGAPIEFNTERQCYVYTRDYSFSINKHEIKGGSIPSWSYLQHQSFPPAADSSQEGKGTMLF